jgi:hypothetical protein
VADKYSVLIKYKYLEYIDNAKLSDADAWVFMRGIIEYDKTGMEPEYANPVLTGLFAVLKCDLDENRDRWEEAVKSKSAAGKKGMEKRWGKKEDITQITPVIEDNRDNRCYQDITGITDLDLDLDLEFVNENGGGNNRPIPKNQTGEKSPPPLILEVIKEAEDVGFFIDSDLAKQFIDRSDHSSWFGKYSFIKFIAIKITENEKYAKKPIDEQRNIFRKLLLDAENLRREYPTWREKQEREESGLKAKLKLEAGRKAARDKAYSKKPETCPKCGSALDEDLCCPDCSGTYEFNNDANDWKFYERVKSLSEGFRKHIKNKEG